MTGSYFKSKQPSRDGGSQVTQLTETLFPILLGSRHQPCKLLIVKAHRTNQYYFKSQTENAVSNNAIMAHLFISTLNEISFECFMKLFAGSIKKWADLEKLFLAHFFEDDTEVFVPTLLRRKELNCLR